MYRSFEKEDTLRLGAQGERIGYKHIKISVHELQKTLFHSPNKNNNMLSAGERITEINSNKHSSRFGLITLYKHPFELLFSNHSYPQILSLL